jgi:hypothetical protein
MARILDTNIRGFSLVGGGPLYHLLVRIGLLKPDFLRICRAAAAFAAITWLPLLVLSSIEGTAAGRVTIPFLFDFSAHVRFLFALPLLIIAEASVHRQLQPIVAQFITTELVRKEEMSSFYSAVRAVHALRNSYLAEALLLLLAFAGMFAGLQMDLSRDFSSWQTPVGSGYAGWWHRAISLPLFRFILFRWLWRLAIWFWLLMRIAKLDLQVTPTHPDLSGGLGFLGIGQLQFCIIIFAFASVVSAALGRRIMYEGAALSSFAPLIIVFILISVILLLVPLMVFSPKLFRAKRNGLLEYSVLADRYTEAFARKWVRGNAPNEELLGTPDIQSLADLANSFEIIRKMRLFPFGSGALIILALSALVPMLPLLLTVFPLDEIVKRIISILL